MAATLVCQEYLQDVLSRLSYDRVNSKASLNLSSQRKARRRNWSGYGGLIFEAR